MIILIPAFLVGGGILVAVFMLLVRAFVQSVQESGHRRLIFAGFIVLLGLVGLVTYLGIKLPREG
jgi:hypothetical protein